VRGSYSLMKRERDTVSTSEEKIGGHTGDELFINRAVVVISHRGSIEYIFSQLKDITRRQGRGS
jgi:hypothetical protein